MITQKSLKKSIKSYFKKNPNTKKIVGDVRYIRDALYGNTGEEVSSLCLLEQLMKYGYIYKKGVITISRKDFIKKKQSRRYFLFAYTLSKTGRSGYTMIASSDPMPPTYPGNIFFDSYTMPTMSQLKDNTRNYETGDTLLITNIIEFKSKEDYDNISGDAPC